MHHVSAMQGGIVTEIDGRPATEVLVADVGEILGRDLRRIAGYIFAAVPIAGSDTGDYLVRNILAVDAERGGMLVAESLAPGDRLMFCRRDAQSAVEDLERMLEAIKPRDGRTPRGAVYYDCVARGESQFGANSRELRLIQEKLGDVPLVGFFGNGEIANARLYAYTGVLTLFL